MKRFSRLSIQQPAWNRDQRDLMKHRRREIKYRNRERVTLNKTIKLVHGQVFFRFEYEETILIASLDIFLPRTLENVYSRKSTPPHNKNRQWLQHVQKRPRKRQSVHVSLRFDDYNVVSTTMIDQFRASVSNRKIC